MNDICIYDYDCQCLHDCKNCPQYRKTSDSGYEIDFDDYDCEDNDDDEYD